jgi:hypothetical protein
MTYGIYYFDIMDISEKITSNTKIMELEILLISKISYANIMKYVDHLK